jgi:dienelactone hydrolase
MLGAVMLIVAVAATTAALWNLTKTTTGLTISHVAIGDIPATVYRPASGRKAPVVLVAHGFAGSQQLMQPFAVTLARNGFIAVTFDFAGHGRNPRPLTGSITQEAGATQTLVAEVGQVAAYARGLGDGRLAVLGHSMASDIVIRFAQAERSVAATIAVSMFSPAVSATSPRNLLIVVGDWEGMLKAEALRAVAQVAAPSDPRAAVTYGDFAAGTARRAAFIEGVEHIGVLYSRESMHEALRWLQASFDDQPAVTPPYLDARGGWILVLLAGIVLLARPLSALLPVVASEPVGAGLGWRTLGPIFLVCAVTTPLVLRVLPTHFLPVLVADYLAAHFLMYGLISALGLWWARRVAARPAARVSLVHFALATLACTVYATGGLGWALDRYVMSFVPGAERAVLILAMLIGTLAFFLTDEWLTRGPGAATGSYAVAKLAFLVSLAIAVGLDFERLFFLLIIVPAIVAFFLVFGVFSSWTYRRTAHPWVGGIANAVSFAWAIGVTFPLLAG